MNKPQPFTENNISHLLAEAGEDFIFLETAKITEGNHHSYLFTKPSHHLTCLAGEDPSQFLRQCQEYTQNGCYLAGWFSYEFGYGLEESLRHLAPATGDTLLASLGVYPSCHIFDHTNTHTFSNEPHQQAVPCKISNLSLSQSKEQYIDHIHKIKQYIHAGDTYQVNYTLKLLFDVVGSLEDLYLQLRRSQQVSFAAYIKQKDRTIMSFSPELFFNKNGGHITVRPMKGTMERGRTRAEDEANGLFLQTDLKNRAENVMIVDLLRNDLGRIAKEGMVSLTSLFDIETYNSLLQMTSTITAEVADHIDFDQLFTALFPCGSVTGAPKIHTMEIIRELETGNRGVYTGAIGFFGPEGQAAFNVPIRTITVTDNKAEMGIGSGIVADSDANTEWQECLLKGRFLTDPPKPFELIETILWQPQSGYQFKAEHGQRLQESAHYFNFPVDMDQFHTALRDTAKDLQQTNRVRLTLNHEGIITIQTFPCPSPLAFTPALPSQPATEKICFSRKNTESRDPFLHHKTTNRALYNTIWKHATKQGFIDAIFTNENHEITEGCISNLFIRSGSILYTPPANAGVLPGVFRQVLLEQFADEVKEETLHLDDLLAPGNQVYIGNSVRGLIPVQVSADWLI